MNTPAIRSRDIDTFDRYEALARLTALDRTYGMVEFDLDRRMVSVNMLFCSMRWSASPICCCCRRNCTPSTDASGKAC